MIQLMNSLILIVPILISVAFVTLMERKVLSLKGSRMGPNKVGISGIMQPITDAIKLSNKQVNSMFNFSMTYYYLSTSLMLSSSMMLWHCSFTNPQAMPIKFSIMMFMLILSLNSMNSIMAGWSTFSKYSLIGSLRTVAQLISYESVLYLCLFFLILYYSNMNFFNMMFMPIAMVMLINPSCFYIWIPSFLAELNRTPYDFSEGESELVSGFNTEFGSVSFTMIFLSEYSNILFFCLMTAYLFFSMSTQIMFMLLTFFVIWIRSVLPRFRFDKLMSLSWKFFIPYLTMMLMNSSYYMK